MYLGPDHIHWFCSVGLRIALNFNVESPQGHELIHLHLRADTLHLRHRLVRPPLHLGLVRAHVPFLWHPAAAALVRPSPLVIVSCQRRREMRREGGNTARGCWAQNPRGPPGVRPPVNGWGRASNWASSTGRGRGVGRTERPRVVRGEQVMRRVVGVVPSGRRRRATGWGQVMVRRGRPPAMVGLRRGHG